jgi:predicted O-methyltransferase YrrM
MIVDDIFHQVPGSTTIEECYKLYEISKTVSSKNCIVEIGANLGRSTCILGAGSHNGNNALVYSIDLWNIPDSNRKAKYQADTTFEKYKHYLQLMKVNDIVMFLRGNSAVIGKTWNTPIGMLFLDGDHSYEGVKKDFELYSSHVVKNGWILFHDYNKAFPDVIQFVEEIADAELIETVEIVNHLYVSRKQGGKR